MAFSGTYDTTNPGAGVSNREDLSSKVFRVVPELTPVTSLAPKGKATATFFEWTMDKHKQGSTLGAGVSEGADVTAFSDQFENRSRVGNYVQTVRDTWGVSKLQQAAASAGPADAAHAKAECVINVKLGAEWVLCSDNDRQQENGAGSPYKTRALGDWIDSDGPSDVGSDYRTPSASIDANGASITEAQFQAVIQSLFTASGRVANNTMVAATGTRSAISAFTRTESTANTTRTYNVNEDATKKGLTYAVNWFDTDYGMISIVNANPDSMPDTDRAYILNRDMFELKSFIPMTMTSLEDQGAGQRGYCDWTFGLCVKNPRAFGKIN